MPFRLPPPFAVPTCLLFHRAVLHTLAGAQGVQNLIHDNNKKVRTAFVGLLLAVKGVKSIRYYQVANVDHILARLSEDHLR